MRTCQPFEITKQVPDSPKIKDKTGINPFLNNFFKEQSAFVKFCKRLPRLIRPLSPHYVSMYPMGHPVFMALKCLL